MAYRGATAEYPLLFLRTITHLLDFRGRSTRTEVGIYVFLVPMLFSFVLAVCVPSGTEYGDSWHRVLTALNWIYYVPAVALFVRRAHDIGKSGWWAWAVLAPAFFVICFDKRYPPLSAMPFEHAELVVGFVKLAVLYGFGLLVLVPAEGEDGRYGPNPRFA